MPRNSSLFAPFWWNLVTSLLLPSTKAPVATASCRDTGTEDARNEWNREGGVAAQCLEIVHPPRAHSPTQSTAL